MASSVVVQFRLPEEDVEFFRKRGIKLNEAAKERMEAYRDIIRMDEAAERLARYPAKKSFDPVQAVREARDDLDRRH